MSLIILPYATSHSRIPTIEKIEHRPRRKSIRLAVRATGQNRFDGCILQTKRNGSDCTHIDQTTLIITAHQQSNDGDMQ